jgi:hypothetical protein
MALPSDLATKIEVAINSSNIDVFRTTFEDIFNNPFFKDCVKSLGPLGYMISGLSCLYILPVIITPDQHSDSEQVEKKEDIANPALEDVADDHLWSEDEIMSTPLSPPVNFIWQTAEVERGMLPQYATFTIQEVKERAAVQLLTARFANSGLLAEFQRMRPIHMEHTTLARSSGITIQAMQILLFKDFFKDILTFSGNNRFRTPLHPHPMFVQGMVVNLQRIIYDFCVAGSGMQAVYACRNRNYTDYMTGVCYLHLFKMLFGMAKTMLKLVKQIPIPKSKIEGMIRFLSRIMFVKLSSDGVNDVVNFIFDLNTLADTMSSRDPPERIVRKFTRIINRMDSTALNLYHHTFPMLFTGDEGEYTFIWLQELLLQKIVIPTRYDWDKTSKDLQQRISRKQSKHHHIPSRLPTVDNPGRGRSRTPSSRKTLDGPTSQTPHQLGHGGSNKKKGSSKKSKKFKKSGHNKKVRANKKSRRSNKYKNT